VCKNILNYLNNLKQMATKRVAKVAKFKIDVKTGRRVPSASRASYMQSISFGRNTAQKMKVNKGKPNSMATSKEIRSAVKKATARKKK
jgi:hypothetical protein